jgi:hypothetical protein
MQNLSLPIALSLAFVSACAPRPEPIVPEPIYDKFGNLEDVCVSDDQMRNPNTTAAQRQLPRCEDRCQPGERPTFTVAGQWPICNRIPEDEGDDPQRPTNPTRG